MNPPMVYEVTNPSAHMIKRITKIVQSIFQLLSGRPAIKSNLPIQIAVLSQLMAISLSIRSVSVISVSIAIVISVPVSIPISVGPIAIAVTIPPRTAAGSQHQTHNRRPTQDSSDPIHKASA
jgi:hypothetical protein